MLYHFYEYGRHALTPLRMAADHTQNLFQNPMNPLSHTMGGRMVAAACEVLEHSTREYGKPAFNLGFTEVEGQTVMVEEEVVLRKPFGQLKHFKRGCDVRQDKMLIVAPMSGHFATLLRGTVEAMLPHYEVYITDWRDAKMTPLYEGHFDLDDYVDYVMDFLEHLGPGAHVMAVCQPSVPVFTALALMEEEDHPARPASLTMMGGPIDTRVNPTEVNDFATKRPLSWFKHNVVTTVPVPNPGMFRRVYPGFLQLAGFMAMNLSNHMTKHMDMFQHLVEGDGESADATQAFYEEYRSVMDLTEEFYLQTVDKVFRRHLLPRHKLTHRGRLVDPSKITRTSIFCVEGELDDISGVGQTQAALDLTPNLPKSKKHHFVQKGVGHYGIFNGRRWRESIAPKVRDFTADAR